MFSNKLEFILWWAKVGAYHRKEAVFNLFAYSQLKTEIGDEPYAGKILELDGVVSYLDEELTPQPLPKGVWDRDEKKLTAWFRSDEEINLKKGDLGLVKKDVKTTYGELWANVTLLMSVFGDRVEYVTNPDGWISAKAFTKQVFAAPRAKDVKNPKPGEIVPREVWKFHQALAWIQAFNVIFTPAATRETMTVTPEVKKLRKELMAEAFKNGKDTDPVYMAMIEEQIGQLVRKQMKGKPGAMFLQDKAKAYDTTYKRMYVTYGVEGSIEGSDVVKTIARPLAEGIDLNHLPEQANTMRGGIAGRGLGTALAGADAKKSSRVGQNSKYKDDDCKATFGISVLVQPSMVKYLEGRYLVGKDKPITAAEAPKYLWKTIELRDPSVCRSKDPNYCKRCGGDKSSVMENSIALQVMQKDNSIMYQTSMGKLHGGALKTKKYNLLSRLH